MSSEYVIAPKPHMAKDAYKTGHLYQYPPKTQFVYSNTTARGSKNFHWPLFEGKVVFVGARAFAQYYLRDYWNEHFFKRPPAEVIEPYQQMINGALGNGVVTTEHLQKLWQLGYLPVRFKALPEGTRVNLRVPLMTMINTHPDFSWITNFLETVWANELWKPITVATIAYEYRRLFARYADETGADAAFIPFQGHDFSARGMGGHTDSKFAGVGHLLSFVGSDTLEAGDAACSYYGANWEKELVMCAPPATEHAVMCLNYAVYGERETYRRLIQDVYPSGMVAIVSDTIDLWNVLTEVAPSLKAEIMAREPNAYGPGKVVFRPDCYSSDTAILTPRGWKMFADLSDDDLVAQVLDDGSHEFIKPLELINQHYEGPMHSFKDHHGKVDLLVTPNHRIVLQQYNRGTNVWNERIAYAEELGENGNHLQAMVRSAPARNQGRKLSYVERLAIAFQADGSYCTGMNSSIRFSFAKSRKVIRLCNLLNEAGIPFEIYFLQDDRVEIQAKVDAALFSKDFDWVNTEDLCSQWCSEFMEELKHWDSSIRNEGRFKFDTTNPKVMGVVERIAIAAGKGILITVAEDNRQKHFSNVYTAHILDTPYIGGQSWTHTVENYKGTVHCVKVPSGKVLVKRNRCVLVSGNSGDPLEIICGKDYPFVFIDGHDSTKGDWVTDFAGDLYKKMYKRERNLFIQPQMVEAISHDYNNGTIAYQRVTFQPGEYYADAPVGSVEWNQHLDLIGQATVETFDPTPAEKGALQILWEQFGGTINSEGYRLLDPHVGLVYGDSITLERCHAILERMTKIGFASSNIVLGIGSFTYQYITRDTFGLAVKATWGMVDNKGVDLQKTPATDSGVKHSAKGLLRVEKEGDDYVLYEQQTVEQEALGELRIVFENGEVSNLQTLAEMRQNLWPTQS